MESLEALETKILRAVEVVAELRRENAALRQSSGSAQALEAKVVELTREVEALRVERETVRQRLEKLLDQIDAVNAG